MLEDVEQTANARHGLTEDRRKGRTEGPHLEHDDAQQIQPDVQNACHQQEIQRALAVAEGTHQGAGHVVQQGERDAHKDGADVNIRQINDVIRRVGPNKDGAGHGHRGHGEHGSEEHRQPDRVGGVAAHLTVVLRAEGPRDRDGKAARDAVDEAQHQIVQAAHAADRRQRFHADEPAHDDGIGQIVKLLKQAAQHQRDRKGEDQLQRAALCHIFCHVSALLWGSSKGRKNDFLPTKTSCRKRGRTLWDSRM